MHSIRLQLHSSVNKWWWNILAAKWWSQLHYRQVRFARLRARCDLSLWIYQCLQPRVWPFPKGFNILQKAIWWHHSIVVPEAWDVCHHRPDCACHDLISDGYGGSVFQARRLSWEKEVEGILISREGGCSYSLAIIDSSYTEWQTSAQ